MRNLSWLTYTLGISILAVATSACRKDDNKTNPPESQGHCTAVGSQQKTEDKTDATANLGLTLKEYVIGFDGTYDKTIKEEFYQVPDRAVACQMVLQAWQCAIEKNKEEAAKPLLEVAASSCSPHSESKSERQD